MLPDRQETKKSAAEQTQEIIPGYEDIFTGFSDAGEKILIRLAAVLALFLVAAQVALLIPAVRETLVRVERLEGVPFDNFRQTDDR